MGGLQVVHKSLDIILVTRIKKENIAFMQDQYRQVIRQWWGGWTCCPSPAPLTNRLPDDGPGLFDLPAELYRWRAAFTRQSDLRILFFPLRVS